MKLFFASAVLVFSASVSAGQITPSNALDAFVRAVVPQSSSSNATFETKGRTGSRRVGGYTKNGKGSRYVGGRR